MLLPFGLTAPEIRVLQEFRRVAQESLTIDEIRAIKHPMGGGETPALSLVDKGFLVRDSDGERMVLTDRAREFLAVEATPADSAGQPKK